MSTNKKVLFAKCLLWLPSNCAATYYAKGSSQLSKYDNQGSTIWYINVAAMVKLTLESTDSLVPKLHPIHKHWGAQG